jgi:hypothetical protein
MVAVLVKGLSIKIDPVGVHGPCASFLGRPRRLPLGVFLGGGSACSSGRRGPDKQSQHGASLSATPG